MRKSDYGGQCGRSLLRPKNPSPFEFDESQSKLCSEVLGPLWVGMLAPHWAEQYINVWPWEAFSVS